MTFCPSRTRRLGAGATELRPATHSGFAGPSAARDPGLAGACARLGSVAERYVLESLSVDDGGLPDEGTELAGAGHRGHVRVLAAPAGELVPLAVKPPLAALGDLADARSSPRWRRRSSSETAGRRQACFAASASRRREMRRPGLGDRAEPALVVRGVLGGDEAEEAAELSGMAKAGEVADLCAEPRGGQQIDPAKAPKCGRSSPRRDSRGRALRACDRGRRGADRGRRRPLGSRRMSSRRRDPRSGGS